MIQVAAGVGVWCGSDDEMWKTNPVCPSMVAWWRGPRP